MGDLVCTLCMAVVEVSRDRRAARTRGARSCCAELHHALSHGNTHTHTHCRRNGAHINTRRRSHSTKHPRRRPPPQSPSSAGTRPPAACASTGWSASSVGNAPPGACASTGWAGARFAGTYSRKCIHESHHAKTILECDLMREMHSRKPQGAACDRTGAVVTRLRQALCVYTQCGISEV